MANIRNQNKGIISLNLFELLKDKHSRDALRNILITRYLSKNI